MALSLNIWNVALALGAAQGILLAAFLILHKINRAANRILAIFLIIAAAIIAAPEIVRSYHAIFPHLIGSTFTINFLLGPALYFYVQSLSTGAFVWHRKLFLHFLPFLVCTVYLLPFYLQDGDYKLAFFGRVVAEGLPLDFIIIWGLACIHVIAYFYATIRLIKQHSQKIIHAFSSIEKINLAWLRHLALGSACIWTIYFGAFILHVFKIEIDPYGKLDYVFGYAMSVLVYAIGYKGLKQPEIFSGSAFASAASPEAKKYERSGLTPEKAEEYVGRLVQFMEKEKPFKNAELTLAELAAGLSVSPNHLSQIINDALGQSFFDFVNAYRVKEAQKALHDPSNRNLTILAIAYEAGFNSKSTFNTAFKKHTRMTPSQFKRRFDHTRSDDSSTLN
jgi:AraC-like DNA-binding protein